MPSFKDVKEAVDLRAFCDAHLEPRGKGFYVCPACGSGNGPHHTAAFKVDGDRWHCFSCGADGDVFDLAGRLGGTDDRREQLEAVAEWAGIELGGSQGPVKAPAGAKHREEPEKAAENPSAPRRGTDEGRRKERDYIRRCRANMRDGSDGLCYMLARGFTREEVEAAGVGYDPVGRHVGPCVVVPWSASPGECYHIDRAITGEAAHKYDKPPDRDVGPQPVHNAAALKSSDVVFIVEGIMDALAVRACGHEAMALCGVAYASTVSAIVESGYGGTVALLLDDDDKGRKAQDKMWTALRDEEIGGALKCSYIVADKSALGGHKDAAEALQADRAALKSALDAVVAGAEEKAREEAEERYREALRSMRAADPLDAVAEIYTMSDYDEPVPTGLDGLDRALDGGLWRGVYVLGAVSSLGKTTLTVQIADHVARLGRGVLFVTIEQSARELVAKSLSRIIKERCKRTVPTRELLRRSAREEWGEEARLALDAACEAYADGIAPRLRIMEGTTQPKVADVAEVVKAMAAHDGEPPVVFIDYLQLLAPVSDRDTDKQAVDRNMMALRQLARDMRTTVFVISSLNRSSYSGVVSLDSFKESGGIEYGGDVLLGLQPHKMGEKLEKYGETKRKTEAAKLMASEKAKSERPSEEKEEHANNRKF